MSTYFYAELTDTYGGDANYCWVRRYKIRAASYLGAIRKLSAASPFVGGFRFDYDDGDMRRYNVQGAAVCAFLEEWDADHHSIYTVEEI